MSDDWGFLVAAAEYLDKHYQAEIYKDKKSARRFNHETFHGFDFDSTMLRNAASIQRPLAA